VDDDVLLMYRSINLAAGAWDCFMGLLTGLPTVVVGRKQLYTPGMLYSLLRENRVSYLFASPVLISEMLRQAEVEPGTGPRPRLATSSGEHLPDNLVRLWKQAFPGVPLLDVYGASEYSSAVIFDLTADTGSEVIPRRGRPATNTRVYVLNEDMSRTATGETGEICLSGSHMALGYLNDPGLTAERFVPNPYEKGETLYRTGDSGRMYEDGGIEVIGRNGEIVNISGFRVGLAEVENALADHEAILESAVVPVGEAPHLVAFVVAAFALSEVDLRKHLIERLPVYMIPSRFVTTDCLPRTPAGKIDRNSLLEGLMPVSRGGPAQRRGAMRSGGTAKRTAF
jgi:acyl-coenzyme A synthetase/AMP-(fatty) acid ligase